eukprot:TRINITY_DN24074_c0_g1_i1.p1 TRINITY_DN24074_c0_g1~~TRINITY_DN24074_c0_g1_i1.p1  ORF type:complete len:432 (-),score=27.50 TRINITY_DN24074_c0_g1_i1:80-1375(-)
MQSRTLFWKTWSCARNTHACLMRPRFIRARPEQTPFGERLRKLDRPSESFTHREGRGSSRFVLKPTSINSEGRSANTSRQRREIQMSMTSQQMLQCLQLAISAGRVDASVFGAAAQRCGQGRWWDALLKVHSLHVSIGVPFLPVQRNMYLTALSRCTKGERGFGIVQSRKQTAVTLGKSIWLAVDKSDAQANIGLNAALHLCVVSADMGGVEWAEQLWEETCPGHKDRLSYSTYALVLETCGHVAKADALLAQGLVSKSWQPDSVDLGALVNAAGERFDWHRAEVLWDKLVKHHGVEPHLIAFVARAKTHLVSGRVDAAARVIDDMLAAGHKLNPHAAQTYIQALLILYHATLSPTNLKRLLISLQSGKQAVTKEGSVEQKAFVKKVEHVLTRLRKDADGVRLHSILLEWKSQNSKMSLWKNHKAGSNYIL